MALKIISGFSNAGDWSSRLVYRGLFGDLAESSDPIHSSPFSQSRSCFKTTIAFTMAKAKGQKCPVGKVILPIFENQSITDIYAHFALFICLPQMMQRRSQGDSGSCDPNAPMMRGEEQRTWSPSQRANVVNNVSIKYCTKPISLNPIGAICVKLDEAHHLGRQK